MKSKWSFRAVNAEISLANFSLTPKSLFFLPLTEDTTVVSLLAALIILSRGEHRLAHSILRDSNANEGKYRAMLLKIINLMSRQKTSQTE